MEILETSPVAYRCYCSRERVERALVSLGTEELEKIIAEQGGCELTCQFCDVIYQFSREELHNLVEEIETSRKKTKNLKKVVDNWPLLEYNNPCRSGKLVRTWEHSSAG